MRSRTLIAGAVSTLALLSCGGGSSDGLSGSTLTGKLLAPDGSTPVAGATVYVPGSGTFTGLLTAQSGCEKPPESYVTYTCTGPDGSFSLDLSGLSGTVTVKFRKGAFQKTVTVNLKLGTPKLGNVSLSSDPTQGAPKMAVVSGYYDRMEIILAKLGFAELDQWGMLDPGTEKFDIYDGDNSYSYSGYPDFTEIFNDNDGDSKPDIYNYDIVFINCGNYYESSVLTDPAKVSVLRDYVLNGGRLYITDLSYDFVEQVFPEFIDFFGSDNVPETSPENMGEAEVGTGGITTEAEVLDGTLREWLKGVSCVDTYGNPVNCIDPTTGRVHIEGFLGGWAVINGPHPGKASDVKVWVRGDVSWYSGSGVRPLTVSFSFGSGKVLYTSYHTETSYFGTSGLKPQERILQHLVFF